LSPELRKKSAFGFGVFSAKLWKNRCEWPAATAMRHSGSGGFDIASCYYQLPDGGIMAKVEKISIVLPADMAALVRRAVETGDYASSSEVIREALREWKARRAARSDAIGEIRRLWDEGIRSGPSKTLDVAAIKKRGRRRLQADRK
jgi:antitoxin ParD1/3/4